MPLHLLPRFFLAPQKVQAPALVNALAMPAWGLVTKAAPDYDKAGCHMSNLVSRDVQGRAR